MRPMADAPIPKRAGPKPTANVPQVNVHIGATAFARLEAEAKAKGVKLEHYCRDLVRRVLEIPDDAP